MYWYNSFSGSGFPSLFSLRSKNTRTDKLPGREIIIAAAAKMPRSWETNNGIREWYIYNAQPLTLDVYHKIYSN